MWEDEKNKRGGRWMIGLDRKERSNQLDKMWLETVGIFHVCFAVRVLIQCHDMIVLTASVLLTAAVSDWRGIRRARRHRVRCCH